MLADTDADADGGGGAADNESDGELRDGTDVVLASQLAAANRPPKLPLSRARLSHAWRPPRRRSLRTRRSLSGSRFSRATVPATPDRDAAERIHLAVECGERERRD